jgi:hypothetical protein
MSAKDYNKLSDSEKKKEDWMNSKWRPMMGWTYMLTCVADFVIFPILWSLLQAASKGQVNVQWQPITLQGAGLFHIAMGAVLGIAAYGRTQEKLGGANNGGITLPSNVGSTYQIPGSTPQSGPGTFGAPTATTFTQSWGSQPQGGPVSPAPSWGTTNIGSPGVTTGFGGKLAPPQPDFYPER